MTWFVASIVSVIKYNQGDQAEYPVFEDFYLFSAENQEELDRKIADKMAIIDAAGSCSYNEQPATQKCIGVRKIRSIYNEPPLAIDEDPPTDGTELTHSFFLVSSLSDATDLAAGKQVSVTYTDDD